VDSEHDIRVLLSVPRTSSGMNRLSASVCSAGTWELAKTLSANSIRQTNAVLRAALAQALKWGWIAANPTAGATPSSKFKPKRGAIAMADVNTMITHAQASKDDGGDGDDVLAMAVTLATLIGVRRARARWGSAGMMLTRSRVRSGSRGSGSPAVEVSTSGRASRPTVPAPLSSVPRGWRCSTDTATGWRTC
jgi:hypothetical protein